METHNILEFVEELMDLGYSEELACREYQALFNPDYCADDHE